MDDELTERARGRVGLLILLPLSGRDVHVAAKDRQPRLRAARWPSVQLRPSAIRTPCEYERL